MSRRARNKHSIGVSQDPFLYNCTLCSYTTRSETGIRLHRKISHKTETTINKRNIIELCGFCGKTFKSLEEITRHVWAWEYWQSFEEEKVN